MALEVDFVTLGDASERVGVPAPTLRAWTDQLAKFDAHYVKRNHRDERIYYKSDIEIFEYLRDLKAEYGRRTTTQDLARLLVEKAKQGEFSLRRGEDAPTPTQSSDERTLELLNQEDIKTLMESERVKQFASIIIAETTQVLKEELMEEVQEVLRKEMVDAEKKMASKLDSMKKEILDAENELLKKLESARKEAKEYSEKTEKMLEESKEREKELEESKKKRWWNIFKV